MRLVHRYQRALRGSGPEPGPHLASAVLSALTGLSDEQNPTGCPEFDRSKLRLVLSITERGYVWDECDVGLTAVVDGDSMRLYGSRAYVFDEGNTRHFLIADRPEDTEDVGLVVAPADASDVHSRGMQGFAGNLAEVRFDNDAFLSTGSGLADSGVPVGNIAGCSLAACLRNNVLNVSRHQQS